MKFIQNLTNKWLNQRIPAAARHSLNHKNIFILPSKFGGLFLVLCLLMFLLGTNYQNNLMLLLCYFLLALFLINLLTSYVNFSKLHIQQGKCPQVFVADSLHLPLWLNPDSQGQKKPNGLLFLSFKDSSNILQQNKSACTRLDLNAYSNPLSLSYLCQTRGKLVLPRVTISSYFPLGLFKCWTHLAFDHQILVYPKPIPCSVNLELRTKEQAEHMGNSELEQIGHDDFSHLKAYQAGEPLHHVAWKQLAKGRGMISKQFSTLGQQIGWLRLPEEVIYNAHGNQQLELEISKLTYQVIELSRSNNLFGLELGQIRIDPNNSPAHAENCLKALALYALGTN